MAIILNRTINSNLWVNADGSKIMEVGGIPNIKDWDDGQYKPINSSIVPDTGTYPEKIGYTNARVKFGDPSKGTRYVRYVESKDGDWVKITLKTIVCDAKEKKNNDALMQWRSGSIIFDTVTDEKSMKETIFQPAGQEIVYIYETSLDVEHTGGEVLFKKSGVMVFKIIKPFYVKENPEYFDFTWTMVGPGLRYELILPAPAQDETVDPTLVFGTGTGDITSGHKDGFISESSVSRSFGADANLQARDDGGVDLIPIGRFSGIEQIPEGSTISSATFRLELSINNLPASNTLTASLRECLTSNGIGDEVEDNTNNPGPAADGSATFNQARDWNDSANDVDWQSGATFGATDHGAEIDTFTVADTDAVGTVFTYSDVTALITNWTVTNNGWVILSTATAANSIGLYSANEATVSRRPLLTVTFTEPVGSTSATFGTRTDADRQAGHKDTYVNEGLPDRSFGAAPAGDVDNTAASLDNLIGRFDLTPESIPAGSVINSAKLELYLSSEALTSKTITLSIHECTTQNGIGDTTEDTNSNPAVDGSATFSAASRVDGGAGDTKWSGGGEFVLANDLGAAISTVPVSDGIPANTKLVFNVKSIVTNWLTTNNGYGVSNNGDRVGIHTEEAVTETVRPLLRINYTPVGTSEVLSTNFLYW